MKRERIADGVVSIGQIDGHETGVRSVAWSTDGASLASCSDSAVMVCETANPAAARRLYGMGWNNAVAWRPGTSTFAVAGGEPHVTLVDLEAADSVPRRVVAPHNVRKVSWSPDGRDLGLIDDDAFVIRVSGDDASRRFSLGEVTEDSPLQWSPDGRYIAGHSVNGPAVWRASDGGLIRVIGPFDSMLGWLAWAPDQSALAYAHSSLIYVIDPETWERALVVEGHTDWIPNLAWSSCGRFIASGSWDQTLRIWSREWEPLAVLSWPFPRNSNWFGLEFHPSSPLLAVSGRDVDSAEILELDPDVLLHASAYKTQRYTTAKVVIVGESGVGKTGLAHRVVHGEFKEHPSTHGQHFWLAKALGTERADGTECEAVLWDLAGQPDYRLTHVLFVDDADAALVLFDVTRGPGALDAVDFWLDALRGQRTERPPTLLVGGRIDRGAAAMSENELQTFAANRGVRGGYLATSAMSGAGIPELMDRLTEIIPWDRLSATVTTAAFRTIKEHVLALKESHEEGPTPIVTLAELREQLGHVDALPDVQDADLATAVRNLEVHGYVRMLRTADGDRVVLLRPELLHNLASSLVLEARANERGLGAIDEAVALRGGYPFPELAALREQDRRLLLEAVIVLLLEHNVCFRERLGDQGFLIFPELINEKPPALAEADDIADDVSYVIDGNVENVYASLVVLLGYTNVLTRRDQWQNRAEYNMDGVRAGFRQERPRADRVELTLYFGTGTSDVSKRLFQGLVEQFLSRRRVTARRFPYVTCAECGYALNRAQVISFVSEGTGVTFCPRGGHRIELPTTPELVGLTNEEASVVGHQSRIASRRTALSTVLAQLRIYLNERLAEPPQCFISYAWGDPLHEEWVRERLVPDLDEAGLDIILDRREATFGDSIPRFISRVEGARWVVVVGTPLYRTKYENKQEHAGTVVAAEVDLIASRLIGTEAQKATVVPVLREGSSQASFPPLLHGRIYADLADDEAYFPVIFDLALHLWGIPQDTRAMLDLRRTLHPDGTA